MPYLVKLKRSVEKELEHLPEKIHDRIVAALIALKETPFQLAPRNFTVVKATEYELAITEFFMLSMIPSKKLKFFLLLIAVKFTDYKTDTKTF